MKQKKCTGCEELKPTTEFYRNKTMGDGLATYCKQCNKEAYNLWWEQNPDRVRKYSRDYQRRKRERRKRDEDRKQKR